MGTRSRTSLQRKAARDFKRVKVTHNEDEANDLLASGWTLLHGGVSHIDCVGFNVKPVFILGEP